MAKSYRPFILPSFLLLLLIHRMTSKNLIVSCLIYFNTTIQSKFVHPLVIRFISATMLSNFSAHNKYKFLYSLSAI